MTANKTACLLEWKAKVMTIQVQQKAWVVFSGETDLRLLKILKRGVRHCFVILNDGKHWIAMDPLANTTEITVPEAPIDFDLPRWLKTQGYTVQPAVIASLRAPAPITMFSCVESVKRVLGIHKRLIITPWQLYKYLIWRSIYYFTLRT